jgi:hypothetical protein
MENLAKFLDACAEAWDAAMKSPKAFATVAVALLLLGYGVAAWYYSKRLAEADAQLSTKNVMLQERDATIERYRVALGMTPASGGALIELSHAEMRAKAATTVAKLRSMSAEMERSGLELQRLKNSGKVGEKQFQERQDALLREFSQRFEGELRADAINVDNELRRRLGPKGVASIVGLPKSLYSASDGAPIGIYGLFPSGFGLSAGFLGPLADGIDQMSRLLPEK